MGGLPTTSSARKVDGTCTSRSRGTTSPGEQVLLTRNEVAHARGTDAELALFVLAELALESGEEPIASGGTEFVFYPWELHDSGLRPVGYEYTLPEGEGHTNR